MKYLFKIQEKIVPELISEAEIRYTILRNVYYNEPIGRRSLARKLGLSERNIRNQLDFLLSRDLIEISKIGTRITKAGADFLNELDQYIKEIKDISNLEQVLTEILGLKEVLVVPGKLEYSTVNKEIGRFTSNLLKKLLKDGDILAVTGGETLSQVANSMKKNKETRDIVVVPGRGGLGEKVEIQANTIAAEIAKKIGGSYRLLQIPDNIKEENLSRITEEPAIQKTLSILTRANILLHGVGNAREMASRRGMNQEPIDDLLNKGAIGEAFGFYFDEKGEIVYSTTSVGLSLPDLKRIENVIAVAGGYNKAKAIISVVSPEYQDLLITDENTAREIIAIKGGEKQTDNIQ